MKREKGDTLSITSKPQESGFRWPAEWEPHEATWIAWPHNKSDWPGKFAPIPWVYGEIIRKLIPFEKVRIIVESVEGENKVRKLLKRVGVDWSCVEFFHFPTDRIWIRDYGPIFLKTIGGPSEIAIMRFHFNAWAKYKDWQNDNAIPVRIGNTLGYKILPALFHEKEIVLEGGAIDHNGRGSLLTTEECLLDFDCQARNPDLDRKTLEKIFEAYLGISNVLWLGRGLSGDDTHGHVDDFCRFVNHYTVVLCQEDNPKDDNYLPLKENRERLQGLRLQDGAKIEIIPLPMPEPLYFDGRRLPASYANFYIGNGVVLVPTFNDPRDRTALGILSELFPGKGVVGINATDLVWGLGTIHCLTQQQPRI
ncbi:MAG: agmatine deiminase family protein [Deltaproteobacteria bacterium]|nr:agmatine deiminase family protein [Deltaproteobacteria bacterium]